VKEFEIQDFDPLLSDVHNPIHITLQSSVTPNINNSNTSQHPTKTQWFDNKRNEFVNTVHNSQGLLTTIINDLENIQARDRCTQQEIDDITNKINDVFSKTASQTFTNKPFKSKLILCLVCCLCILFAAIQ
jgi:archaellum component FlaC